MSEAKSPFNVRKASKVTDLAERAIPKASNNLPEEKTISMTFNMPEDWHRRFKMAAVSRGIHMKELFEECFSLWEHTEGRK